MVLTWVANFMIVLKWENCAALMRKYFIFHIEIRKVLSHNLSLLHLQNMTYRIEHNMIHLTTIFNTLFKLVNQVRYITSGHGPPWPHFWWITLSKVHYNLNYWLQKIWVPIVLSTGRILLIFYLATPCKIFSLKKKTGKVCKNFKWKYVVSSHVYFIYLLHFITGTRFTKVKNIAQDYVKNM